VTGDRQEKGLQVGKDDFREFLNERYRWCALILKVAVVCGFLLALGKAFRLQVLEYEKWQERLRTQSETTFKIPCYRGTINDRNGRVLAFSVPQPSLFADGKQVDDPRRTAARLAPVLGESAGAIRKKLSPERRFIWLDRQLSDYQATAVDRLRLPGIHLVNEYKRFYPYRRLAGQTLGFVGLDGVGLEGVELSHDGLLRQNIHEFGQYRDGSLKPLWRGSAVPRNPEERLGLRLSIEAFIQHVCEGELEKVARLYRPRAAEVVVMDPETFEVLAMANWPSFDPNVFRKASADQWRNRAVTDSFEPGSTFKVFLLAAALDRGVVGPGDRIYCENGRYAVTNRFIHDTHAYRSLTIPQVLKYSSNIGAAKIAMKMGKESYYEYIRAFGFGSRTGLRVPGETGGILRSWRRWYPIDLAVTGFGQSIGVTGLQLTAALAAVANEGRYMRPLLVREIVDHGGEVVKSFLDRPVTQVVRPEVARKVGEMMVGVTEDRGTGKRAAMEHYTVAGKTGTAQILDPATRRYSSHKYTSIFTGFVPAEKPRLVMSVVVHEPQGEHYGGVVAAPVFREIAAKVLPYLGVTPSFEPVKPPVKVRWVKAAAADGEDLGQALPLDGTGDEDPVEGVFMPSVEGMSLKMALHRLPSKGIDVRVQGTGKVVEQNPRPGTLLKDPMRVTLKLQ